MESFKFFSEFPVIASEDPNEAVKELESLFDKKYAIAAWTDSFVNFVGLVRSECSSSVLTKRTGRAISKPGAPMDADEIECDLFFVFWLCDSY
jgi:hypothetical protein